MGGNIVWRSSRIHSGAVTFQYFLYVLLLIRNDTKITSYANDDTPYAKLSKINLAIEKLEQCFDSIFTWFQNNNGIKANAGKCHFLVRIKVFRINNVANNNKLEIKINEIDIESSPQEKLLARSNFRLLTRLQKSYEQPM